MAKQKTEIIVIIDQSGSMADCRNDVIGGFNTYLSDLKKDSNIDARVSLTTFNSNIKKEYTCKKLADVDELTHNTYSPTGSTALNDAFIETVKEVRDRIAKSKAKSKPKVLCVVFTDGEENASRNHPGEEGKRTVKELIDDLNATGFWTFVYMGADQDAWSASQSYGFSAANSVSYGKGATAQTMAYMANRTKKFAMADLSQTPLMSDSLMALDAEDEKDAETVALRTAIDTSALQKGLIRPQSKS